MNDIKTLVNKIDISLNYTVYLAKLFTICIVQQGLE